MSQTAAMLLTLAVEVPLGLAVAGLGRWPADRRHWLRLAAVLVAMSLITHPFAWTLNVDLAPHLSPWARVAVIEVAVAAFEGLLLWRFGRLTPARGFGLGAVVNAASFGVGLLFFLYG
ncbi:MAG: hypothetical protein H6739_15325 [Alphaproteobacteria bacterium]|nr:hypothetical protein [Alphaproteobacteria bacterium]